MIISLGIKMNWKRTEDATITTTEPALLLIYRFEQRCYRDKMFYWHYGFLVESKFDINVQIIFLNCTLCSYKRLKHNKISQQLQQQQFPQISD